MPTVINTPSGQVIVSDPPSTTTEVDAPPSNSESDQTVDNNPDVGTAATAVTDPSAPNPQDSTNTTNEQAPIAIDQEEN